MISFIIISILLAFLAFRCLRYTFKHFTPLALILGLASFALLLGIWEAKFNLIDSISPESQFPLIVTTDFYWFTSILILLGVIILRDLNRNLYFERLTTDLVRVLAIENARKQ